MPDLLEVCSKPVHVLVIGQQSVVLSMEEVDVPDPQQRQQDRGILVQGGSAEVVVLQQRTSFTFMLSVSSPVGDETPRDLPSNELLKEAFQSSQNLMRTGDVK